MCWVLHDNFEWASRDESTRRDDDDIRAFINWDARAGKQSRSELWGPVQQNMRNGVPQSAFCIDMDREEGCQDIFYPQRCPIL